MAASGELKTKPTQHSVKQLLENGLQPDILVLRTEKHLTNEVRRKVALFCNVDVSAVVESIDVPTIYEVPLMMLNQKLDIVALDKLQLPHEGEPDLAQWIEFVDKVKHPNNLVHIALVGKYTELPTLTSRLSNRSCMRVRQTTPKSNCTTSTPKKSRQKISRHSSRACAVFW